MDVITDEENGEAVRHPLRIVTDWRRFASGLWRLPEGDIAAAYCADTFPKLKVFKHVGRLFANGGNCFSGPVTTTASCHVLIPPEVYSGPSSVRYSYEGKEGFFHGKAYRLGPKVLFESSDPSVEEWTRLLRILYADGGAFAHGATYHEFLQRITSPTPHEQMARAMELANWECARMPETQDGMRRFLDCALESVPPTQQLALAL